MNSVNDIDALAHEAQVLAVLGKMSKRDADIRSAHAADAREPGAAVISRPCEMSTVRNGDGWVTSCASHEFERTHTHENHVICCDFSLNWLFLAHTLEDETPPELLDLTGVYHEVRGWAQNRMCGNYDYDLQGVHRYLRDGTCQRDLTFKYRDLGDDRVECYLGAADPTDFKAPESWPEPSTYAKDGTTYLRFTFDLE